MVPHRRHGQRGAPPAASRAAKAVVRGPAPRRQRVLQVGRGVDVPDQPGPVAGQGDGAAVPVRLRRGRPEPGEQGRAERGEQRRPRAVGVGDEAPRSRLGRARARRRARRGAARAGRRRAPRRRGRRRCGRRARGRGSARGRARRPAVRAPSRRTTSRGGGVVGHHHDLGHRRAREGGGDGVGEQREHQLVVRGAAERRPSGAGGGSWRRRAASPGRRSTTAARLPCEHTRSDDGPRCGPDRAVGSIMEPIAWRGSQQMRGVPVAQDASSQPAAEACAAAAERGRMSLALWIAVAVVYPLAALLFRLRYRHAERIPRGRPGPAGHQPHLDPRSAGLRPAGLGQRAGAALPRQGVGLQGARRPAAARRRADPGRPVHRRRPRGAARGGGRPRRGQRRRDLPRGLGDPRSGLVADGVAHRGRPAGADHRRRRPAGGPVGRRSGRTTTTRKKLHLRLRDAGGLPGRGAGRPLGAAGPAPRRTAR